MNTATTDTDFSLTTTLADQRTGDFRSSLELDPAPSRPLKTLFVISSLAVGGAETLLVNTFRNFRKTHVIPSVACLKKKGLLGEAIESEFEVTENWLTNRFDLRVLPKLTQYIRRKKFDAVITVGAGDKMFWGRLCARLASVPVICSAVHSTGWPDVIGELNRSLTPITDAYIGVAKSHGKFLTDYERFPAKKVVVIPNGVDTDRFFPNVQSKREVREELGLSLRAPLVGIVASLRHEKNHALFVQAARHVVDAIPEAQFMIIGEGPERKNILSKIESLNLTQHVRLLGNRFDTQRLLASLNVFVLTSHTEASPVSILEALSCGVPVVSTRVGSVTETVYDQWNGFTVEPGNVNEVSNRIIHLLRNPITAEKMGLNGREHVQEKGSLNNMVRLYEQLIHSIYARKTQKSI